MTIRVVLADDHPIVRAGIRTEFSRDAEIEIIGEALTGDEALKSARELQPDVLLLDINMPGLRAIHVLREVKGDPTPCKVLILTAIGDVATIIGILNAGADGYLLKDETPELIIEALRAVASGSSWYSPSVSSSVVALMQSSGRSLSSLLTKREVDVIGLLTEGRSNKEISLMLGIAERTVEFHLGNLMERFQVRSRLELVLWARQSQGFKDK